MHKLIVMGVSGCGKSTLALALAQALSARLIEGDEHHLPQSQAKMNAGIALTDADREPWLDALGAMLAGSAEAVVLSCSALRRRYRDRLRAAAPGSRFVYMAISREAAQARVALRSEHFFPASLVASQFEALEPPNANSEADVISVDAEAEIAISLASVLKWLSADAAQPR
jgi:gluconokinase